MQWSLTKKIIRTSPLFLLLFIIPLLKSTDTLDQGLLIRFLALQITGFFMLGLLVFSYKKGFQRTNSPLLSIIILFTLYCGLRLLWGNVYSDSVFDWLKTLSYFALLVLLIRLYSYEELKKSIPLALSFLGIVLVVLGLTELIELLQKGKLSIPLSTYHIKAVFGHRNLYAQVLFLTFPFQVVQFFADKNRVSKSVYVTFISLTLFLLIILSNRTVWLSLVIGITMFSGIYLLKLKKYIPFHAYFRKKVSVLFISLSTTLLLSILFFVFLTETNEAEKHISNIVQIENGSGKDRIELWNRTLQLIEEAPVFGCGGANWKIEMLKYGNKGLVSENNITFYQRPHNDFLWISSEYGLLGGMLYILIFLLAFWLILSQIRKSPLLSDLVLKYATLFALIGFLVFSFFSFPHERVTSNMILMSLFALIIKGADQTGLKPNLLTPGWIRYSCYTILSGILAISFFIGLQRYKSETHTHRAMLAKMNNHPEVVIDEIMLAESVYYQMDPLSTPLAWYSGLAWYQTGKTDSALICFTRAYELNPYHVHVLNDLASAYAQNGEIEKAIEFYKKALLIYPEFEESALNLCAVYYNSNQIDSAYNTLQKVDINTTNPQFKPFLMAVLKGKMKIFLDKNNRNDLNTLLPSDQEWYYHQYLNHISSHIPIEILIFDSIKQ